MSYGFCYVIVLSALLCQFSSVLLCQQNTYGGTLFSPSTQYAVKYSSTGYSHRGLIKKVSSLCFSLLKLILYSTQSLSLKKSYNEYLQYILLYVRLCMSVRVSECVCMMCACVCVCAHTLCCHLRSLSRLCVHDDLVCAVLPIHQVVVMARQNPACG